MKERQVAITTRLALELERLRASAPENPNGLVFGITDNVKRSFTAARGDAGLKDLRFNDLRHMFGFGFVFFTCDRSLLSPARPRLLSGCTPKR